MSTAKPAPSTQSPHPDVAAASERRRRRRRLIAFLIIVAGLLGYSTWYYLFREVETRYDNIEEHFKYGSVGIESNEGVPYWIWLVLPRMFPEKLPGPGGYTSLGIVWEEGKELPVGFSKKTVGFDRVAINCALCHVGTLRNGPDDKPTIILGAPSHQFNAQGYIRFLQDCASDPKFNPDEMMAVINNLYALSPIEKALYRYVIIPQTKRVIMGQREEFAWMNTRPAWGRGRIDPFNPMKFRRLGQPVDDTIGNSDMVPLWNMRARQGMAYHWDGLNDSIREVVLSSAIGDGATEKSIALEGLQRIEDWLMDLQPPKYPYAIDQQLAAKGSTIFQQNCASCHAFGAERTGTIIPLEEIGTDRHRLDMWTENSAKAYNGFAENYRFFSRFRKTGGYVAVPLDGLWLRAPYLHNGSVPSLTDLLEPPDKRPTLFYRGYDVYDPQRVGFVSFGPDAERRGFRYDTSVAGNSNGGHLYGTQLSADDKKALIEYMKTL